MTLTLVSNLTPEILPRVKPFDAPDTDAQQTLARPTILLAHKSEARQHTQVRVGASVVFGGNSAVVIAGPCAVESREQMLATAAAVKAAGANMLRGGAFKPRTSPYDFQGLGETGLQLLSAARELTGLPFVTEVLDTDDLPLVAEYADMLQVGARNMQNFSLLKHIARTGKPVMLKRGASASVKEWLLAAEYLLAGGNDQVVLCERGIKTFETATRNTLDLAAVALVKELSHLPVIVDPSHATGKRSLILPAARAGLAVGADGLMIEVHPQPEQALSDGAQSLTFAEFGAVMRALREPLRACGATGESFSAARGDLL